MKVDWRPQGSKSHSKGYSIFSDCMASYGYPALYGHPNSYEKNNDTINEQKKKKEKNNILMNIALEIIGPCMAPCLFFLFFQLKANAFFKFLWFVKSLK